MQQNYKPDTELPMKQQLVFCAGIQQLFPALDIETLKLIYIGLIPSIQVVEDDVNIFKKIRVIDELSVPEIWLEKGKLVARDAIQLAGYAHSICSPTVFAWVEQEENFTLSSNAIRKLAELDCIDISSELVKQAVYNVKNWTAGKESLEVWVNKVTSAFEKREAVKYLIQKTGD